LYDAGVPDVQLRYPTFPKEQTNRTSDLKLGKRPGVDM